MATQDDVRSEAPAFTPGPWYCEKRHTVFVVETATKSIANVSFQGMAGRDGSALANASLIAAAPDYAEAAALMIAAEQGGGDLWWKGFDMLKAAHAKARAHLPTTEDDNG